MVKPLGVIGAMVVVLTACPSTRNPKVCCISADDCAAIGLEGSAVLCADGLACVNNACEVASCSTDGCGASAPVCNVTRDVCEGCIDNAACSRFDETKVCAPDGGCVQCVASSDCTTGVCDTVQSTCVECLTNTDCPASRALCDEQHTCRACVLDADCNSGACDEGTCIDESRTLYVAASGGSDSGTCSRAAPCATIQFAVTKTSSVATHIVLLAGTYDQSVIVSSAHTAAPEVNIHGTGAMLILSDGEASQFWIQNVETTIVGVFLGPTANTNPAIQCETAPCHLRRVRIQRTGPIITGMTTTIEASDLDLVDGISMDPVDSLTVNRSSLRGPLGCPSGGQIEMSNTMLAGAINAPTASGTIRFSTLVTSGDGISGGPRVVKCGPALTVRESIVWAGGTAQLPLGGGCTVTNTIAGPTAVAGALNMDPQFVSFSDFHLSSLSPARDLAASGPPIDFEGQSRPSGNGYDLGADEFQ